MPTPLESWPRPYFAESGGEAFLFYAVFGDAFEERPLSASKYRTRGVPDGFQMMSYARDQQPDVFRSFQSGYLWEKLGDEATELASQVAASGHCVVLRGSAANPPTLNYFRDCIGMLTYYLDCGGCAVYDPQMFKWWPADEWRAKVFEPAGPEPAEHVVILTSGEEESPGEIWIHTRGLRKFGRPDLSIRRVGPEYVDAVAGMCNRFIEFQALGGVIAEGQEITMKSLPAGGVARHGGSVDDPDFNNVHVEIVWPAGALGGK